MWTSILLFAAAQAWADQGYMPIASVSMPQGQVVREKRERLISNWDLLNAIRVMDPYAYEHCPANPTDAEAVQRMDWTVQRSFGAVVIRSLLDLRADEMGLPRKILDERLDRALDQILNSQLPAEDHKLSWADRWMHLEEVLKRGSDTPLQVEVDLSQPPESDDLQGWPVEVFSLVGADQAPPSTLVELRARAKTWLEKIHRRLRRQAGLEGMVRLYPRDFEHRRMELNSETRIPEDHPALVKIYEATKDQYWKHRDLTAHFHEVSLTGEVAAINDVLSEFDAALAAQSDAIREKVWEGNPPFQEILGRLRPYREKIPAEVLREVLARHPEVAGQMESKAITRRDNETRPTGRDFESEKIRQIFNVERYAGGELFPIIQWKLRDGSMRLIFLYGLDPGQTVSYEPLSTFSVRRAVWKMYRERLYTIYRRDALVEVLSFMERQGSLVIGRDLQIDERGRFLWHFVDGPAWSGIRYEPRLSVLEWVKEVFQEIPLQKQRTALNNLALENELLGFDLRVFNQVLELN